MYLMDKTVLFGTIFVAIAAMMMISPAMAAVTNETGTVTTVATDTVTTDSGAGPFPVDGGFPAACNSVGSPVTFNIDLDDIEPRASGVACVVVDDDGDKKDKKDKVTICHKPLTSAEKTLKVPASAVAAHIAHGDYHGPCEV